MANMWVIENSLPSYDVDGKGWINYDTGQSYIYINGDWRVLCAGNPYNIYNFPFTVFIDGIDRTGLINIKSFIIKDNITSKVDTCTFILEDINNTVRPEGGQDISIWYKQTALATEEKVFGGVIATMPQTEMASGQKTFQYRIQAVDYSRRLRYKLAVEDYTSTNAGDIVKDLISTYFTNNEFTVNNVEDGIEIDTITFNYKDCFSCIKELADITDYDWYVDYDRDIHFFSRETNIAPYKLTESIATTGHYKDLNIDNDSVQIKNYVTVRGGVYLSDLYTDEQEADGQKTGFLMQYSPRAPISVYVDGVAKTLGIDGIDESGYDFVVNYGEKLIKNLDLATLTSGQILKVTYTYEIQILGSAQDENSILQQKQIDGGDGIRQDIIIDTSIASIEEANDRALAEINRYSDVLVEGTFKTDQYGYKSGQLLTIEMPTWGYDGTYMIQSVTKRLRTNNEFMSEIKFATYSRTFVDYLVGLGMKGKSVIVRENETLQELIKLVTENITLSGTTSATEFTGSYVWSNDAGTTTNAGYWDLFQWN